MAAAILLIVVTLLPRHEQRRSVSVSTVLSAADLRLLSYLQLTPAQWRSLTDFQRAALRERAYRSMN
jgi:hypothetical protein